MNNILRKGISVILCVCLVLALSSCTIFKSMRENAEKAKQITILDTPDEQSLAGVYDTALTESLSACEKVDSSVSFQVKDASVSGAAGKDPALLDAAAGQFTALIMQDSPGSESKTLTAAEAGSSMLANLRDPHGAEIEAHRNEGREAVTDEKGNEQSDENGDIVTRTFISDNLLEMTYRFYTETVVSEAYTDEDGNSVDAVTERKPIDTADIEAVFGAPRDKTEILSEFDAVKDYLQVRDYTLEYTDSFAKCEVDLESNRLTGVTFEKHMTVTADVIGRGSLADYDSFKVSFTVIEASAYEFHYPVEE